MPSYDELKDEFEGYYEYQNQWGLDTVNASAAYARGATGLGITIGITDSGLDSTHTEISAGRLSGDSDLSYSNYTPNTRQQRHGTMVASVAAADSVTVTLTFLEPFLPSFICASETVNSGNEPL